jgi:hypothetical protein
MPLQPMTSLAHREVGEAPFRAPNPNEPHCREDQKMHEHHHAHQDSTSATSDPSHAMHGGHAARQAGGWVQPLLSIVLYLYGGAVFV